MFTEKQIERMLGKLERFEAMLEPRIFSKVAEVGARAYETTERLHKIPDDSLFKPVDKGFGWGGEGSYCWFKTEFTVPAELDGKDIFIKPHTEGYETLLWVNGMPFGTFATKIVFTGHGNHYCDLLKSKAKAGEKIEIALEVYAGHAYRGTMPFEEHKLLDYNYHFGGIDICVKDYEMQEFYFDLRVLNELTAALPETSFRRGQLVNTLYEVHKRVYYSYEDTDDETFREALRAAKPFMKEALAVKNGPEAPTAGIIGHSHMDTAWLWTVPETEKKCARTYSNQLSLMEQYPEYKFIQSSSCHSDMIRRNYPELFERIKEKVAEGRYEPNGGVWVECDCNITSGESMVRQFLWGQRFTRKYFGYTSNCFWLPDTFGYSAAIPQIMKGCDVDYFLTTKMDWNDTNIFPYDTFYWQGIDGTKVFTHFNRTHCWPAPDDLSKHVYGKGKNGSSIKERSVTDRRLISFGYGDGGGGPQFEMIEESRRVADLNGCCKTYYTTVGDFMTDLEQRVKNPSTYAGELYLELHRGTLTNQHNIKRNNRKAELALRDLEILTVGKAVKGGEVASDEHIHPLYEKLLMNQFHDILPGTCIHPAHVQSLKETGEVIAAARRLSADYASGEGDGVSVTNTLSFDRNDPIFIECPAGYIADIDCKQQHYTDLDGREMLIISGVTVPAFSSISFKLVKGEANTDGSVKLTDKGVSTPFAEIEFDGKGYISSFYDKRMKRQLRGDGYAFNTLLVAEDVPTAWDNWDVDADLECKFADHSELLSREVVSAGAAAVVIRSKYSVSKKSTVTQDAFYFADTAEVRFDTLMDWQDDHRFMKAAFDTSLHSDYARFEIQYGNVLRPTTRNNTIEKAKFEVVNHKYTDLSETRCGAAVLNDGKYAISVEGGNMRLSLHKGGTRPDYVGDHGLHRTVYSFLPHVGGFGANEVIKPAYELNVPAVVGKGGFSSSALVLPKADNVIVEVIKPCEDNEKAFIARLYEAEGTYTVCPVEFFGGAKKVEITNMLEEVKDEFSGNELTFKPFEIKTLKVIY